jgi:hypothetical protein
MNPRTQSQHAVGPPARPPARRSRKHPPTPRQHSFPPSARTSGRHPPTNPRHKPRPPARRSRKHRTTPRQHRTLRPILRKRKNLPMPRQHRSLPFAGPNDRPPPAQLATPRPEDRPARLATPGPEDRPARLATRGPEDRPPPAQLATPGSGGRYTCVTRDILSVFGTLSCIPIDLLARHIIKDKSSLVRLAGVWSVTRFGSGWPAEAGRRYRLACVQPAMTRCRSASGLVVAPGTNWSRG